MKDIDINWLVEHGPEIYTKYPGKWIAVRNGKVIAVGDTAIVTIAEADKIAPDGDYILEGVDSESDVIYGAL